MSKELERLGKNLGDVAGKANAWDSLQKWLNDSQNNPQTALMTEVSQKLHADGCQSAWVHTAQFIEALFERISDLESELKS